MPTRPDDETKTGRMFEDARAADKFAAEMDQVLLDISELDEENCPPDRRFFLGEREAWVYEHGNISELVFVKTE